VTRDPRHAVVERAVKAAALALLSRDRTVAEVVAALAEAVADAPGDVTPRESAAVARQSRRAKMITELIRLEQQGHGRSAAMLVARKFAGDPRDPIEVESLARQLRRWRARKTDSVRLPSPKSVKG
jgi:hypothetical protein